MSNLRQEFRKWAGAVMAPAVVVFTLAAVPVERAQAQGVSAGNIITVTGKIAVINRENRSITLIDGEGGARNIAVPEAASEDADRFDEIKRGDIMTLSFVESVEIFLDEPGSKPSIETTSVDKQLGKEDLPEGAKGGRVIGSAVQVSAKITAIDKEKRVLTLQVEDGSEVQKEVPPDAAAFDQLKVGDTIAVRVSHVLVAELDRPQDDK